MRRMWEKFRCQEGSWFHKQERKKKKKKTERNGQEENIDDIIERPEFILKDADDLKLRDDSIAIV